MAGHEIQWGAGTVSGFNDIRPLAPYAGVSVRLALVNPASDSRRAIQPFMARSLTDPGHAEAMRFAALDNVDRLKIAMTSAILVFPAGAQEKLAPLLTPANLALMAGFFAVFLGIGATPVGAILAVSVTAYSWYVMGSQAIELMAQLVDFGRSVLYAQSEGELRSAGVTFGKSVAHVSVDVLVAILLKKATVKLSEPRITATHAAKDEPKLFGKYDRDSAQTVLKDKKISEEARPRATPPGRTVPSGAKGGKPSGIPKKVLPQDDASTIRSTVRENESADTLAKAGYKVEQLKDVKGQKSPDYLIEGKVFDCKAPSTDKVRNAASEIEKSVSKGQADRMILNLDDSPIKIDAMKKQLTDYPIEGLKEVLVIKNGEILPIFP